MKPIEKLKAEGFDVEWIDRGGEVTYHGPGQLVMYPIIHLRERGLGARLFVEKLENVMIRLACLYGLSAQGQIKDRTGVWVHGKKIGAIGIRISNAISSHGIAFNVRADLSHYLNIVPCGLNSHDVTNLASEVGGVGSLEEVEKQLVECFVQEFRYDTVTQPSHTELFQLVQQTENSCISK